MDKYENHKVLITGASSGIGKCLAIELSKRDNVIVLCGRDKERLEEVRSKMNNPKNHILISFELNDFERYGELFDRSIEDGRKLDGMVHCAGIADPVPIRMLKSSTILNVINTNYTSLMCMINMYTKKKYCNGGSIVAVSSVNAHYVQKYMSVYAASKAAIEASVRSLALELFEKNIRINTIVPGAVNTPMSKQMDNKLLESITEKQIMGLIEPEQVVNGIIYLLSNDSSYMTGRELYIDGGRLGQ